MYSFHWEIKVEFYSNKVSIFIEVSDCCLTDWVCPGFFFNRLGLNMVLIVALEPIGVFQGFSLTD